MEDQPRARRSRDLPDADGDVKGPSGSSGHWPAAADETGRWSAGTTQDAVRQAPIKSKPQDGGIDEPVPSDGDEGDCEISPESSEPGRPVVNGVQPSGDLTPRGKSGGRGPPTLSVMPGKPRVIQSRPKCREGRRWGTPVSVAQKPVRLVTRMGDRFPQSVFYPSSDTCMDEPGKASSAGAGVTRWHTLTPPPTDKQDSISPKSADAAEGAARW